MLEDALVLNRHDLSSPNLAQLIETERCTVGNSFNAENVISSKDFKINNSNLRLYAALPLDSHPMVKKSAIFVSADKNSSIFCAKPDVKSIDINTDASIIKLGYGARVSDYLDLGIGINQSSVKIEDNRTLGYSYGIRFLPFKAFSIEYSDEKISANNLTNINYGEELLGSQSGGGSKDNSIDKTEIAATFKPGSKLAFRGFLGRNKNGESVKVDANSERYFYLRVDRTAYYGGVGVEIIQEKFSYGLDLIGSETNISSDGGLFALFPSDLMAGDALIDKTGDVAAKMKVGGFRISMKNSESNRLRINGALSCLKVLFDGDAKIWDSLFFGMARRLDAQYVIPVESADVLVGSLAARFIINKNYEINYSVQQMVPISVVQRAQGNGPSEETPSSASGGNIQTFAVACYF